MQKKIFISSSSKDRKAALTLCAAIEARGYACWISGRDVSPGQNFQEAIVQALRKAPLMVLVFSANANNSSEIKKEVALASQNDLIVIPVRIEDVVPSDALSYEFATRQWIDAFDDWEQAMQHLIAHIAQALGAPDIPAAPTVAPAPVVPVAPVAPKPAISDAPKEVRPHIAKSRTPYLIGGAALLVLLIAAGVWKYAPTLTATPHKPSAPAIAAVKTDPKLAPEMVTIPAGQYMMGTYAMVEEDGEYPQHLVIIATAFAMGKFDVTRGEFARFVAETHYKVVDPNCDARAVSVGSWDHPGFSQTDRDPVVCVNWYDAQAYIKWLNRKTGQTYRLPSEAEWEYAARAGTTTRYYWGNALGKGHANCDGCGSRWDNKRTSPAGSFAPNAFGLYDMSGNVWQWTEDCQHPDYKGAPDNGAPWYGPAGGGYDCGIHVKRGGAWPNEGEDLRSAERNIWGDNPYDDSGFRLARTL